MARKLKKPKGGLKLARANESSASLSVSCASWNIGCLNQAGAVCAGVRQHDSSDLI